MRPRLRSRGRIVGLGKSLLSEEREGAFVGEIFLLEFVVVHAEDEDALYCKDNVYEIEEKEYTASEDVKDCKYKL